MHIAIATASAERQSNDSTIQRLENAWSIAYLRGDTGFEKCLLSSDFAEILRTGEVKFLSDELGFAEKNKGKNPPPSVLPVWRSSYPR